MPANKDKQDELPDTVPVYNVNDGPTGRNGGPYLDEELAKEQERRNALREGREPDYSDLTQSPHPGVQLVTADQLLNANREAGHTFTGEITAPIYGYIPNPAKVEKERVEREAKDSAARAEADADETVKTEKPAAKKPAAQRAPAKPKPVVKPEAKSEAPATDGEKK